MSARESDRLPKVLRAIAGRLIRSPDALFILDDMDEIRECDVARGMPSWRVWGRYGRNVLASAYSVWRGERRNRGRVGISLLDIKLGGRMLIKYPVVSLVGGLGLAVAIAIGAGFFDVAAVVRSTLPFEEGERIVAIENWDTEWNNQERRIPHDFVMWRDELKSIENLGAYRTIGRNLIIPGGETELVYAAEMTASGFALARVPALLGRTLLDADEHAGAPPVVVIGHDLWLTRFASDPGIIGREIRLGSTVHTVVGVMPEGFAFPISHRTWIPFRADPNRHARREGPGIHVFGRLAEGATLESAHAELTTIAQRMASAFPDTHERLRPRVVPYTMQLFDDMEGWEIPFLQGLILLLLVVVCVNVAILVYARTATRQGEIAVRSALGASRRRIVAQLFIEALVFSAVSAVIGLAVARVVPPIRRRRARDRGAAGHAVLDRVQAVRRHDHLCARAHGRFCFDRRRFARAPGDRASGAGRPSASWHESFGHAAREDVDDAGGGPGRVCRRLAAGGCILCVAVRPVRGGGARIPYFGVPHGPALSRRRLTLERRGRRDRSRLRGPLRGTAGPAGNAARGEARCLGRDPHAGSFGRGGQLSGSRWTAYIRRPARTTPCGRAPVATRWEPDASLSTSLTRSTCRSWRAARSTRAT